MKKTICPTCNKKTMKAIRFFNDDRGDWKRDKRSRRPGAPRVFSKIKKPSRYTVILRCERASCKDLILRGRSRSVVHAGINNARRGI